MKPHVSTFGVFIAERALIRESRKELTFELLPAVEKIYESRFSRRLIRILNMLPVTYAQKNYQEKQLKWRRSSIVDRIGWVNEALKHS